MISWLELVFRDNITQDCRVNEIFVVDNRRFRQSPQRVIGAADDHVDYATYRRRFHLDAEAFADCRVVFHRQLAEFFDAGEVIHNIIYATVDGLNQQFVDVVTVFAFSSVESANHGLFWPLG